MFQIWRFFSHARRKIYSANAIHPNARGLLLTLDTWLTASRELQEAVLTLARGLSQEDMEILEEDCRPVIFCSIQDLEANLSISDEDTFLRTLEVAHEDRFLGWAMPNIHFLLNGEHANPKPFPFQLSNVLPWRDEESAT